MNNNSRNKNEHINPNEINIDMEDDIYLGNPINKKLNKNTLKIFNIPINKVSTQNYNSNVEKSFNSKLNRTHTNPNDSIIHLNHSLNHSVIISGIYKLNDLFIHLRNNNNNDELNEFWKTIDIHSIISNKKLNSNDPDEIMFNGNINKMILSNIFKNCSMNIQKFCILTKNKFFIYQNKENFLLTKNCQRVITLNQIENCGRVDLRLLNIQYLYDYFYMYIELKDEYKNDFINEDEVYKIVKKEQNGQFFILFSKDEKIVNQWVFVINYFLNLNNR